MSANGTRRINRGRGHSYELDGEKVPGITTVLRDGYPKDFSKSTLEKAARYVADYFDDLAELKPTARERAVIDQHWQALGQAKLRGTLVHRYAEHLAAGHDVEVPDEYLGHVDAYLAFAGDWDPAELLVEAPFFSRKFKYAGTPDLVATLNDGHTWLLDWKTGAGTRVFLDWVLQLAASRYAEFVLDEDGGERPVSDLGIDRTGIVLLRDGEYDLVPVEANEEAFAVFRCCRWVHRYTTSDDDQWIGDALVPGVPT